MKSALLVNHSGIEESRYNFAILLYPGYHDLVAQDGIGSAGIRKLAGELNLYHGWR